MKRTGLFLILFLLALVTVGAAAAADDVLVQKFHNLIPPEKLNQPPTLFIEIPDGEKLDPGFLGEFYGYAPSEGATVAKAVAVCIKVSPEGRASGWIGWEAGPHGTGVNEIGGKLTGKTIEHGRSKIRLNYNGTLTHSLQWGTVGDYNGGVREVRLKRIR